MPHDRIVVESELRRYASKRLRAGGQQTIDLRVLGTGADLTASGHGASVGRQARPSVGVTCSQGGYARRCVCSTRLSTCRPPLAADRD
jgi:hypothetical protein